MFAWIIYSFDFFTLSDQPPETPVLISKVRQAICVNDRNLSCKFVFFFGRNRFSSEAEQIVSGMYL